MRVDFNGAARFSRLLTAFAIRRACGLKNVEEFVNALFWKHFRRAFAVLTQTYHGSRIAGQRLKESVEGYQR
jgi:hypothetical protein